MAITNKPTFAPGCYGSALAYQSDDICKNCPFADSCSEKSEEALTALRAHLGVAVPERRRDSGDMSIKAEAVFKTLGKTAREIRSVLMGGRNPFPIGKGFMGTVCHVLLNNPSVTRAYLADTLEAFRGVKPTVAETYTRQAIQILRHCEVVAVEGETISLLQG